MIISEPGERKARATVHQLEAIGKEKQMIRERSQSVREAERDKKRKKETEKFEEVHKEHKRKKFATEGLEKARREKRV